VDTLMVRQESNNTQADLADLRGARFVQTSETEEGQRLAQGKLKRITQGMGKIKATRKYENPIEFDETHKLWMDTNRKPTIRDVDDKATFNRLHPIPFTVTIPKDQIDKELPDKLLTEAEGILAWAVEGARLWYAEGLAKPAEVEAAKDRWREDMDQLGRFIDERCVAGVSRFAWSGTPTLPPRPISVAPRQPVTANRLTPGCGQSEGEAVSRRSRGTGIRARDRLRTDELGLQLVAGEYRAAGNPVHAGRHSLSWIQPASEGGDDGRAAGATSHHAGAFREGAARDIGVDPGTLARWRGRRYRGYGVRNSQWQHYLPKVYLTGFGTATGEVWRYDCMNGALKLLPPRVIGAERDLYSIIEGEELFQEIEMKWFNPIDGRFGPTLRKIENLRLTDSDLDTQMDEIGKEETAIIRLPRPVVHRAAHALIDRRSVVRAAIAARMRISEVDPERAVVSEYSSHFTEDLHQMADIQLRRGLQAQPTATRSTPAEVALANR
jgi:Protein of unknown function (DUF4238)